MRLKLASDETQDKTKKHAFGDSKPVPFIETVAFDGTSALGLGDIKPINIIQSSARERSPSKQAIDT